MDIKQVAVIGAGIMGRGVAEALAVAGIAVILIDREEDVLQQSREQLRNDLRMRALFRQTGASVEEPEAILERIEWTTHLEALNEADFIVENVPEVTHLKKELYQQMAPFLPESCVIALNTSCVSITELASGIHWPERVIGVHFMNPVPLIAAVEVIRGYHTSEDTLNVTTSLMGRLGKEAIVVNDLPGFVSNRISHLMMNEAAFVVQDQVATVREVDDIFKKCYGHKMGPLETADLIGLDTVKNSLEVLYESYQDSKFRCCPLLKKMVDAGLHGRKTGEGFYQYHI
ncbi:3-hydroxyacyl-CoA dehydrogenase family protein [Paenibacillus sp. FSL R7-0048]|uniref:3-hydroxyacyl-CoA dehydrogenase family protein n=1 Tax=Paenibacillus sp. FSL R7-0048 TaxID=2954528 RepID=UPI0030F6EB54